MENFHTQLLPDPAPPEGDTSWRGMLVELLETILLSAVLFLGINSITARIRIESISMVPTLHPGDFVIVNKLAYRWDSPRAGDVVVFRLPHDPSQRYIKRVIGLPGDRVEIADGAVYVNDRQLLEPYLQIRTLQGGNWVVEEGAYFVLGDNRNNSSDSRIWGMVPRENVIGKAWFTYWPPEQWGGLTRTAFAAGD